jgi:hypothetical protein
LEYSFIPGEGSPVSLCPPSHPCPLSLSLYTVWCPVPHCAHAAPPTLADAGQQITPFSPSPSPAPSSVEQNSSRHSPFSSVSRLLSYRRVDACTTAGELHHCRCCATQSWSELLLSTMVAEFHHPNRVLSEPPEARAPLCYTFSSLLSG